MGLDVIPMKDSDLHGSVDEGLLLIRCVYLYLTIQSLEKIIAIVYGIPFLFF
jgi:hypothetical protein